MTTLERLTQAIDCHFSHPEDVPVAVSVSPKEVQLHLKNAYDFSKPIRLEALFDDVDRMLRRWTEHAAHPMHFGLFRPAIDEASVMADALVALYDPNLATWDFAPAANEIEAFTLAAITERLGFDPDSSAAHFTSGGQESNQTAVTTALTAAFPAFAEDGIRAVGRPPVFYTSEEGHHSLEKVAHVSGLGRRSMKTVPVDPDLRIRVEALRERIHRDRNAGLAPFLVVVTAGTTNAGVIDPLRDIAELAHQEGLWLHVDAAWGGGVALSDRLRPLLDGIEQADSITCDAHKLMSVPVGAGMFFTRHPDFLSRAFGVDAPYVPDSYAAKINPLAASMQWSRRFMGLKLFMLLAARGLPEVARRIEHQTAMGDRLRRALQNQGWSLANQTVLPVVCFSHPTLDHDPQASHAIVRTLKDSQEAWISQTTLSGRPGVLRACITNHRTLPSHVDRLVELLERERTKLAGLRGSGRPVGDTLV